MDGLKPLLNLVQGDYVTRQTRITGTGSNQQIANAAPDRCLLLIWPAGLGGNANIGIQPLASSNDGFTISSTTGGILFISRDHPGLVGADWYCITGGGSFLIVQEVFYRPRE